MDIPRGVLQSHEQTPSPQTGKPFLQTRVSGTLSPAPWGDEKPAQTGLTNHDAAVGVVSPRQGRRRLIGARTPISLAYVVYG